MLSNLALGSLVVAVFSGSCAFGVGDGLKRITRPMIVAVKALGLAIPQSLRSARS